MAYLGRRTSGAKGKARHIVDLCRGISPEAILDVGAGEGSALEELSTLGFGKRYWAAEISSSGVATIEARGIANRTEVVKFDGYSLPYEDLKFDLYQVSLIRTHFNETL